MLFLKGFSMRTVAKLVHRTAVRDYIHGALKVWKKEETGFTVN